MKTLDLDHLLALLKDPNVASQEVADLAGVTREEAGRAARLVLGLARAKPEDAVSLPGTLAAAVARAAVAGGRPDLVAALAVHPEKEVAKEAKRALHRLKVRGVPVPEPARPAPPAPPPPPAEPPLPCHATAVDGHGERAVWLARAVPGRGVELAQAVVSDERGLLELQLVPLGRKEHRAFVKQLLDKGRAMGIAELDLAHAHALVAEARRRNDAAGTRVPEGAELWLAQLGPAAPPPDPAARLSAPLPAGEEAEALAASGALHGLPLLRGWLADEELLRRTAQRLDEAGVSPLYVDERQRAEQMDRIVADAVAASLDGERRGRLAARLFAVADHLERRGDAAHARAAAAAARALAAGRPPEAVPFARALVEKAFPAAGRAAAAATAGEGAAPGEPAPAPPAPPPLIVPGR
jgi:hypothetical protein